MATWSIKRYGSEKRSAGDRFGPGPYEVGRWRRSKKRERILARLRTKLQSAPPAPKQVARAIKSLNEWKTGEVIGFRLLSDRWVLLRVIGHHEDRGGKFAVLRCEVLPSCDSKEPLRKQQILSFPLVQLTVVERHITNAPSVHGNLDTRRRKRMMAVSHWIR